MMTQVKEKFIQSRDEVVRNGLAPMVAVVVDIPAAGDDSPPRHNLRRQVFENLPGSGEFCARCRLFPIVAPPARAQDRKPAIRRVTVFDLDGSALG